MITKQLAQNLVVIAMADALVSIFEVSYLCNCRSLTIDEKLDACCQECNLDPVGNFLTALGYDLYLEKDYGTCPGCGEKNTQTNNTTYSQSNDIRWHTACLDASVKEMLR